MSWSPKAEGVLLLSQRQVTSGRRFPLRLVLIQGDVRVLADLPGEPVAGSWVWAADGHAVAFLVRASAVTGLVALDTTTGELWYLDDLRPDVLPSSGAVAPGTWTISGEVMYAAPARGGFPGPTSSSAPVLFTVAPGRVDAQRVGDIQPVWAPMVRPDGVLLTLARGENDVLVLRPVDPQGHSLAEQQLGVQISGAYAARWDLAHQQLLIVRRASGQGVRVLLLRFGPGDLARDPDPSARLNSASGSDGITEVVP